MTKDLETLPPEAEIEALLAWYATGRVGAEDHARIEAALAANPQLRESLALVKEDLDQTISLNEALDAPSAHARDTLFARIEAERRRPGAAAGLRDRVAVWLASLTPRTLAWSAAAAALVILLQGGMLMGTWIAEENTYQTASGTSSPGSASGSYALVAFAPQARAEEIIRTLERAGALVVDGPRPGGLFRVRLSEQQLTASDYDRVVAELRAKSTVIRTIVPAN